MNQEIENYLIKAQNYLKDCQILEHQGGSSDSIVSRAYYAMYYVAKALLLSIGQDAHNCVLTAQRFFEVGKDFLNKNQTN